MKIGLIKHLVFAFLISSPLLPSTLIAACLNGNTADNPDSAYTVHGNGTVTDTRTGLMWKVCSEGQTWVAGSCTGSATTVNWATAISNAEAATYAAVSDWRLPNVKELASLVEECAASPAINTTIFPGVPTSVSFWSSTPVSGSTTRSFDVEFATGYHYSALRTALAYVRLVRAGNTTGHSYNGQCGVAHNKVLSTIPTPNQCIVGTASPVTGTAVFSWTCSGNGGATANCSAQAPDTTPNAFSIPQRTEVSVATLINSSAVTITGINTAAAVTLNNGAYSIGCTGSYIPAIIVGAISNGQTLCIQHQSASTYNTTASTTVTIGGTTSTFVSKTIAFPIFGEVKSRYRLYLPPAALHLYTTDVNEYNVLPSMGWSQEGIKHLVWSAAGGNYAGILVTPYYRLYNRVTTEHHWTTDFNEYTQLPVLSGGGWVQEGIDGHVIPSTANTVTVNGLLAMHRLYQPTLGRHLWTVDTNERNVLIATAGWVSEGIAAYVIPYDPLAAFTRANPGSSGSD